nr:MAG TPA: hypothetical protein [Caudoviricetes sp.]
MLGRYVASLSSVLKVPRTVSLSISVILNFT